MKVSNEVSQPTQLSFHVVQDTLSQIRETMITRARGAMLNLAQSLFEEEVESLSGKPFSRKGEGGHHRAGSDPGSVVVDGERIAVKKPRVKKNGKDVPLQTYSALQGFDLLCDKVMKHIVAGVSARKYDGLVGEIAGGLGLKKSSVSKAFAQGSREILDEMNGGDLSAVDLIAMMIDGVEFAERTVVVAMGIQSNGEKRILGLREGDTENAEVCKDLLASLVDRGLDQENPFLIVLDGSKALRKAARKMFASFPVQRCIRHKERNILEYLPGAYHSEFRRRWKLLHGIVRFDEAKLEYERLRHWLGNISEEAVHSLDESNEETLTLASLRAPGTIRKTLLSTNPIESAFDKVRANTNRVKRWRTGTDQIVRWSATMLREAEKSFRKIRGHKEIPIFLSELRKDSGLQCDQDVA